MDQRGAPAIDRAGAAEAALPAGGFGGGHRVSGFWRGDGNWADDHGGWRADTVGEDASMDHLQRTQNEFTRQAKQFSSSPSITAAELTARFVDAVAAGS